MARKNQAGEYAYRRTARIRGREDEGRFAVIQMGPEHTRVVRPLADGTASGPGELVRTADVLDVRPTQVVPLGQRGTITLPGEMRRDLGMEEGMPLEVTQEEDGRLSIRPLNRTPAASSNPDLDALLARVTPENLHEEIPTGEAIGREAW